MNTETGEEYALDVVSYMQTGTVIELNGGLSLSAAQISREHKLPMADSIIYATSLHYSTLFFHAINISKIFPVFVIFQKRNNSY
jgi:hypothetical protein